MKKQLRNIAFAAAVLACGTAVAQDSPAPAPAPAVLEPAWTQIVPCSGAGNVRFGMGYNGKIYFQDKGAHTIVVADGTSYENYVEDSRLTGTGVTIDQVGNIVASTDFPNNSSSTNFLLIDTNKNITEVNLNTKEGDEEIENPGRVDQMGRAIGDFMSEEGGVFYIAPGSYKVGDVETVLTKIYGISLVSGKLDYDKFGFASCSVDFNKIDNSWTAVPRFDSMEAMYEAVEDGVIESASDAFYARGRGSKTIYEVTDNQIADWVTVPDNFTTYGFDAFELQGKKYVVVNMGTAHTQNFQVYCVTDGQRVAVSNLPEKLGPSAQLQFNIDKVSDTKVNIYAVVYESTNVHCSMTPFEVGGGEEEENVVYYDNSISEWTSVYAYVWDASGNPAVTWPGTELSSPVDNVYTYVVPEGMTKIIFNNASGDQTKDLDIVFGKTYDRNSTGTDPVFPDDPVDAAEMYVIGNLPGHDWEVSYTGAAMTKVSDGVFVIESIEIGVGGNAYFAFITTPGADWNAVNAGGRFGATSQDAPIAVGETADVISKTENSWKIATGTYKLTLDTKQMKLTVSQPSGVEAIEAEVAPAVYYNLQGVKIDNPANGLYIVKRGNKVTKEMVK